VNALLINGEWHQTPFPVENHGPFPGARSRAAGVVNCIVLHQSVTRSRETTERVLRGNGYGVHLLIDEHAAIHAYGDLALASYGHANERNRWSLGLEIVNPYTKAPAGGPWAAPVPSPTAWRRREVPDTDAQLDAAEALIRWLTSRSLPGARPVEIPLAWPTTSLSGPTRGHPAWWDLSVGGVIAHGHRPSKRPDGSRVSGVHADARRTAWLLRRRMEGTEASWT